MTWRMLRKGGTGLHVAYGATFSNNLTARDARVRTTPQFELSLDLNGNLRTRNKSGNDYADAFELARGEIKHLKMVQLSDTRIIEGLQMAAARLNPFPKRWTLTLELQGAHSFIVKPEIDTMGTSIFLRVIDGNGNAV